MTSDRKIPERKTAGKRKEEIVLTTLKLADKVGPDKLSATMVAQDIGISQPAIFRHFSDMSSLWLAVASHIEKVMKRNWRKASRSPKNEYTQLQDMVQAQLRLIQSIPAVPSILFSRELHVSNKKLRQAFLKIMGALHNHIADIIVSGQKKGIFSSEVDAVDSAYLIIGFIQGLAVRWSISGKDFSLVDEGKRLFSIQIHLILCDEALREKSV